MWTSVRSTAARQLRVSRAAKVNTGLSVSSRVAIRPASFVVPSSYRLVISSRSFSDTGDQAAAKAAAKPAVKKSKTAATTKKPAAKKATAGKKTAAKKAKPVAKKAAPKKRAKKVLDPETKRKLEIRELKKIALLDTPKQLPHTAYLVYNLQNSEKGKKIADVAKERATEYHALSPSEKARLEITATENRLVNKTAYKNWLESHDPVAIDAANRARRRLRRISPDHKGQRLIKDDRLPKMPVKPYSLYVASRFQTGEYAGQSFKDATAGILREWKSLGAAEKKELEDRSAADQARYANEVKTVLHREVRSSSPP